MSPSLKRSSSKFGNYSKLVCFPYLQIQACLKIRWLYLLLFWIESQYRHADWFLVLWVKVWHMKLQIVLKALVPSLVGWLSCHILGQVAYFDNMARFRSNAWSCFQRVYYFPGQCYKPRGKWMHRYSFSVLQGCGKKHKSYKHHTAWGSNFMAKLCKKSVFSLILWTTAIKHCVFAIIDRCVVLKI